MNVVVALKKSKQYTNQVVSIGGTLTNITRLPDGTLQITFTPTVGAPIVFNAGIVPAGKSITAGTLDTAGHLELTFDDSTTLDVGKVKGENGETPQFRMNANVFQLRFPSDPAGVWTDLYTLPSPLSYTHIQTTAATVWNIQHNLGGQPVTILAVDDSDEQIVGQVDVSASTANLLVYRFSEPIVGKAHIKF
jgi:hypothetical protein